MWIVCITSVRHVLTVNGYGGRQTKENEKSWCFKGWETLVIMECLYTNHLHLSSRMIAFFYRLMPIFPYVLLAFLVEFVVCAMQLDFIFFR